LLAVTLSEEVLAVDMGRLKACLSDCVLIRYVYTNVTPDEELTRSRVKDVFHVGRRLKQPQKEQILSRLKVGCSCKSKSDEAGNDVVYERVVHVVADLRSLSAQEEHQALPGVFLLFLCHGGEKETRSELAKRHDAHRDAVTSLSASETTRLDFVRCHLLAAAARIKPGDFVLDAFVGSGATLDAAALHGAAATFGSDRETACRGCSTICDASSSSWRRHSMDALICDPPYTRRTSGLGETCPEQTLRILFCLASHVVKPGGMIAFWWTDLHTQQDISNMLPRNLSLVCYGTDDLGMGKSSSKSSATRQEADVCSSWKRVLIVLMAIVDTSEASSTSSFPSFIDHKIFPLRQQANKQKSSDSMFSAAWRGDVKSLKAMLEDQEGRQLEHSIDVNEVTDNGVTVLMYSCGFGREEVVQYLCTLQSLDINYSNPRDGSTALIRAARFGHAHIVKLLLARGANLMHFDNDQGYSAVLHAAAFDHVGVLSSFPPECLAAQIVASDGCGILHVCSQWGSLACLDYLLSLSANFALRSHDNTTPLHLAARHNHHLVVSRLLLAQHLSLSPHDADSAGNTPLSLAIKWQRHRVVALFS